MDIAELHEDVIAYATESIPNDTLTSVIVQSIRGICNKTHVYKIDSEVTLPAGQDFILQPPEGFELLAVKAVSYEGRPVQSCDALQLTQLNGIPSLFTGIANNKVRFNTTLPNSTPLTFSLAVRPKKNATEIDDDFATNHSDAITHGAVFRLYERPGDPWFNASIAEYHKAEFRKSINDIKTDLTTGYGQEVKLKTPRFI